MLTFARRHLPVGYLAHGAAYLVLLMDDISCEFSG